jgi:pSer/pThr/pTyr-binding forkhead associated (FHA) protein
VKCPQCGYEKNKPEATSCNLCHAVLQKEKSAPKAPTMKAGKPLAAELPVPGSTRKHLLVRAGAPPIELEVGKLFTIGRQTTCSLPVPSNRVSRVHAEIKWDGEQPVIVDKGSSNGTFVGGKSVTEHRLATGDEVEIGPFHCVYRFDDPGAQVEAENDPMEGTATIAGVGDFLSGRIGEEGLLEVLQGLEFNRKSGTLEVFAREGRGWLTLREGVPYAAEATETVDEEAVHKILAVKDGRFTFLPEQKVQERRMKLTITAILLEAGRRADEKSQSQNLGATQSDE